MTDSERVQTGDKILIIGGGLAGVTTAYELARAGASVTVIEANDDVALETSFANGGMLTPSQSDPWNSPGITKHLFASLFDPAAAMKLHLHAIPDLTFWGLKFLRNSTPQKYQQATEAGFKLAAYSVKRVEESARDHAISYDASAGGSLRVFGTEEELNIAAARSDALRPHGLKFERLSVDAVVETEPQLKDAKSTFIGGLYYPDDRAGDARKFTQCLAAEVRVLGVDFRTGVRVSRLVVENGAVVGAETSDGVITADHIVLTNGIGAPALAKGASVHLPIKPVKGYSLTFEMNGANDMLRMPVVDDSLHIAATPLGTRIRAVGTAEFTGVDKSIQPIRIKTLHKFLHRIQPALASRFDIKTAEEWAGLRPMSVDGLPFIGGTPVKGLWVNAGHGHLGWTMSMGSAALLTNLMTDEAPPVDPAPYRVGR